MAPFILMSHYFVLAWWLGIVLFHSLRLAALLASRRRLINLGQPMQGVLRGSLGV
jgi:membrane protein implicated in regulation of membrane protease activity